MPLTLLLTLTFRPLGRIEHRFDAAWPNDPYEKGHTHKRGAPAGRLVTAGVGAAWRGR